MKKKFLGPLSPQQFLRDYWQKKPLFIKHAFSPFKPFITPNELAALAMEEETRARIVLKTSASWKLLHGPFKANSFKKLPARNWSLLVQNVNQLIPAAERFLNQFDFIPRARLDDLMVSFATPGGGVGPHFDSYDVFLVQAMGKRRWLLGPQADQSLIPGLPLKILRNFKPRHDFIVEPGDLLYLPPGYGHHGIALEDCVTYSIGFRAPTQATVAAEFLNYLQDKIALPGLYSDRALSYSHHPAAISPAMVNWAFSTTKEIHWTKKDVAQFLGIFLTEPPPHVYFSPPNLPLAKPKFYNTLKSQDLHLSPKSNMLFNSADIFINGEVIKVPAGQRAFLIELADRRILKKGSKISRALAQIFFQWYSNGYVILSNSIIEN